MPTTTAAEPLAQAIAREWHVSFTGGTPSGVWIQCLAQGWGQLQFGRSIGGGPHGLTMGGSPLCLGGRIFAHGLGTHADSEIKVRSGIPIRHFRAQAGVDDSPLTRAGPGAQIRLVFSLAADGRELWRSAEVDRAAGAQEVAVTIPDQVHELRMRARSVDGNVHFAHADWAEATITLADGSEVRLQDARPLSPPLNAPAPFSFRYDGRPSSELLPTWERSCETLPAPAGATIHVVRWLEPKGAMECELEITAYDAEAALEWLVRFRHAGKAEAAILEDIQAIDQGWVATGPVRLLRGRGSTCTIRDFEPVEEELKPGAAVRMAPGGGRSSNDWLPFLDLEVGDLGMITAIGWTGQWTCACEHGTDGRLRLTAGMERTRIRLRPGEEIRSPRMLQMFWTGDRTQAHNRWRQLLLARQVPRAADGGPVSAPITTAHWGGMKSADHLARIELYRRHGLKADLYWVDAGWYGPADSFSPNEHQGDWAKHVGNWQVNPAAHPGGLRVLADAARAAGMGFMLWFEPERAICGTPWTVEHPEWFLGERTPGATLLLDLGNPEARTWLVEKLSDLIATVGIACYRQDFNMEPLAFWRAHDEPDRQGMTEIRHIEGLYALWDELRRRHPGLLIDNCASGGRRIDLETIHRSIPLWRSDWQCYADADPIGSQVHGMGLSPWVPLHGTGTWAAMPKGAGNTYQARSAMGPGTMLAVFPYATPAPTPDHPWDWQRRMIAEARRVQTLATGDYYPLTRCHPDDEDWAAYQLDRPDLGEGLVMAFRRRRSPWKTAQFRLRGLDPAAEYEFEDADAPAPWRNGGQEVTETGLEISIPQPDSSRLIFYRRIVT